MQRTTDLLFVSVEWKAYPPRVKMRRKEVAIVKKVTALVLCLVVAFMFSVVGCQQKAEEKKPAPAAAPAAPAPEKAPAAPAAPAPAPEKAPAAPAPEKKQ